MNSVFTRLSLKGLLLPLVFCFFNAVAQTSSLDKYVQEGLRNNLVLQQKNLDVKKAYYSLKTAESVFMPTINLESSYQSGAGGRNIALPLGDLMNPVYNSLNQLLGSEKYQPVKNVEQAFLPSNFYDVKVRASIPIVDAGLKYNRVIEAQKTNLENFDVQIFKLELVQEIKVAYYNYLSAIKTVSIYESSLTLANENRRTNERLLKNGKGLPSYVLRSQSEVEVINAHITEAKKTAENAMLYFNFLLNRPSQEIIDTSFSLGKEFESALSLMGLEPDVSKRPELKALNKVVELNGTIIKMNKSFAVPKLNAFLDFGAQSQAFAFNNKSLYYIGGIQLSVPLFNGKRNLYKIQQSELDKKNATLSLDHISKQLTLAATTIKNNLIAVQQSYQSSVKSLEFAASYQRLIERGFKEGVNTFIEDIDARNLLTSAQLQVSINQFKVLIAAAKFERETASIK
jgi:outer membrane protein